MDTETIIQIITVLLEKMEQDHETENFLLRQKYEEAMKENKELLVKLRKPVNECHQ